MTSLGTAQLMPCKIQGILLHVALEENSHTMFTSCQRANMSTYECESDSGEFVAVFSDVDASECSDSDSSGEEANLEDL